MDLKPVTLKGRLLTLEALEERYAPDIFEAMRDEKSAAISPGTSLGRSTTRSR